MKKIEYIVYIISYVLFLLFGFLLVLELFQSPTPIGIMFLLAMTSGFYFIKQRFKEKQFPKKESKFKSRIRD